MLELLVLRVCQRSSPHQGSVMVAKDVLLNPEHSFNMVLEQWSSQMAGFAYKMQSLQLDMAEFACVNAIMLFEQGDYFLHSLNFRRLLRVVFTPLDSEFLRVF